MCLDLPLRFVFSTLLNRDIRDTCGTARAYLPIDEPYYSHILLISSSISCPWALGSRSYVPPPGRVLFACASLPSLRRAPKSLSPLWLLATVYSLSFFFGGFLNRFEPSVLYFLFKYRIDTENLAVADFQYRLLIPSCTTKDIPRHISPSV